MTVIERFRFLHRAILRDEPSNLTIPRGVVIHDQVHIQRRWHGLIDVVEKRDEFLVPMAWLASRNDLASDRVECGKQRLVPWRM